MATTAQINEFIETLGNLAVSESNRRIAAGQGFVLPSVCIAQSALETGWGTSGLMTRANAYFGIKAGGSWTGKVYSAATWEVLEGSTVNITANFRAYDSLADSVKDYYDLIGNSSRYSNALSFGTNTGAWKTPKECITAIWSGGYATDTLYVEKIMSTITARKLTQYDARIDGVTITNPDAGNIAYDRYTTFTKNHLGQGAYVPNSAGTNLTINNNLKDRVYAVLIITTINEPAKEMFLTVVNPPNGIDFRIEMVTRVGTTITNFGPIKSGDKITIPPGPVTETSSSTMVLLLINNSGGALSPDMFADNFELILHRGATGATPGAARLTPIAHFVKIE